MRFIGLTWQQAMDKLADCGLAKKEAEKCLAAAREQAPRDVPVNGWASVSTTSGRWYTVKTR